MQPDTSSHTQEVLLQRARQGERDAVEALCTLYREPLLRFCYRHLGQIDEAEDATQEVLSKMAVEARWPSGSIRAWLYRIARNRCLDLLGRRRDGRVGAGTFFAESGMPSPRTGPRTALSRNERAEQVRRVLASMSRAHGEVLMLRYFDDLGRDEIAEVLGLPVSVVKSRLYEARQEMSRRLGRGAP